MLEDSVDSFVARWRRYAADVELFPRHEGSPLLECRAGTALVQLFERTGPYLWRPGAARVIIHPIADTLEVLTEPLVPGAGTAGGAPRPGPPATMGPSTPGTAATTGPSTPGPPATTGTSTPGTAAVPLVTAPGEATRTQQIAPSLEVEGVSRLRATGRVTERDGNVVVVDAGVPLVVGVIDEMPAAVVAGAWVRFRNRAPTHGFVLDDDRRRRATERPDDAI